MMEARLGPNMLQMRVRLPYGFLPYPIRFGQKRELGNFKHSPALLLSDCKKWIQICVHKWLWICNTNLVLQTVSGRLRQATYALLHLIGVAVGFADLPIGLRRSIGGVGKVRMLCGVLHSNRCWHFGDLPISGGLQTMSKRSGCANLFLYFYMSIGDDISQKREREREREREQAWDKSELS